MARSTQAQEDIGLDSGGNAELLNNPGAQAHNFLQRTADDIDRAEHDGEQHPVFIQVLDDDGGDGPAAAAADRHGRSLKIARLALPAPPPRDKGKGAAAAPRDKGKGAAADETDEGYVLVTNEHDDGVETVTVGGAS